MTNEKWMRAKRTDTTWPLQCDKCKRTIPTGDYYRLRIGRVPARVCEDCWKSK